MSIWMSREVTELLDPETSGGVQVLYIKMEEAQFGHMSFRMEKELRFLYVLKGELLCQVNRQRIGLVRGEGLFLNRGSAYRLLESQREGGELLVFSMAKDCLREQEMTEKYVLPIAEAVDFPFLKLTEDMHGELLRELFHIGRTAGEKPVCFELEQKGTLYLVWAQLYRAFVQRSPGMKKGALKETDKLLHMLSFLHTHYREKVTLGEMAEDLGVSSGEYCRFFKKRIGQTPFSYLQAYRIEQSLPALLEKSGNIGAAALDHGFHGASYYAETFKKEMGCAPGDYRKWWLSDRDKACPLKKKKKEEQADEAAVKERSSMPAHLL